MGGHDDMIDDSEVLRQAQRVLMRRHNVDAHTALCHIVDEAAARDESVRHVVTRIVRSASWTS